MQEINFKKLGPQSPEYARLNHVYETEFPAKERTRTMRQMVETPEGTPFSIRSIWDGDKAVGFNAMIKNDKWVYLLFLGIDSNFQNQGYGGKAIKAIVNECGEKPMFFAIEALNPNAENAKQRIRRKDFYLKQGMYDTGVRVSAGGVDFEMMSSKPTFSPEIEKEVRAFFKPLFNID